MIKHNIIGIVLFITCLIMSFNSLSQENCINRKPVVAGTFYPDNEKQLKAQMEYLFAQSEMVKTYDDILALLVPHAGYVYSGKVAASGYNQLDADKKYDNYCNSQL